MKLVLYDYKCRTVPAMVPETDNALKAEALKRHKRTRAAAAVFSNTTRNTGQFRSSIHVEKHEKGYWVTIDDPNALSIIYGHEYDGWAKGHAPFEGHPEIIAALLA